MRRLLDKGGAGEMRWLLNFSAVLFLMIGTYALMGPNSSSMMINIFNIIHSEGAPNLQGIFDYIQFIAGLIFISFAFTWIAIGYMLKKLLMIRKATHDNPKVYTKEERRRFNEERRRSQRRASDKIQAAADQ